MRAEVVEHARGEKIIVFRYKSKVRYRRKTGHRQSLTRVRITDILLDGASTTPAAPDAAVAEPETPPAGRRRVTPAAEVDETPPEVDEAARVESGPQLEMPASAAEAGPSHEDESEKAGA